MAQRDIYDYRKIVAEMFEEEDLPTGEYELCQSCFGEGCPECEEGLNDITGQFRRPDFSKMEADLEENTYATPMPIKDMLQAGFPDLNPGDKIRTRKMSMEGVVDAVRTATAGYEEVLFRTAEGKLMRTPLSNVVKLPNEVEEAHDTLKAYDSEEEESVFQEGDKVKLIPQYADDPNEVFWVSQCDPERKRCWIGDEQGRGWYARFSQLVHARKKKKTSSLQRESWTESSFIQGPDAELDAAYEKEIRKQKKAGIKVPDYPKSSGKKGGKVPKQYTPAFIQNEEAESVDAYLDKIRTPEYLEKRAIDQLKALPQPVAINGGSYAYTSNVQRNSYVWRANDGSVIRVSSLRELGEYLDAFVRTDWDSFLDDGMDADDLIELGVIQELEYREGDEPPQ